MIRPRAVLLVFMIWTLLACNLVAEGTLTDDQRLVRAERPALLVLAPTQNSVYSLDSEVILHALVTDAVGVSRVEFELDIPGGPQVLTYNIDNPQPNIATDVILRWQPDFPQLYFMTVRAFRAAGDPNDVTDDIPSNEIVIIFDVVGSGTSVQQPPQNTAPTATTAQTENTNGLQVFPSAINAALPIPVRQGPGISYSVVQNIDPTATVNVVGRSEDSLWFVIELSSGYGWILRDVVLFAGDIETLPTVASPTQD